MAAGLGRGEREGEGAHEAALEGRGVVHHHGDEVQTDGRSIEF